MMFATSAPPHVVAPDRVARVMRLVIYALIPTCVVQVAFFGPGVLVQLTFAVATALTAEAIALRMRGKPVRQFVLDGSAIITAILLALCLPPLAPWWLVVSGTGFAILLAKHAFGGLGANPFNPAMVGYAVLLVSFPARLLQWIPPELEGSQAPHLSLLQTIATITT
jgi:electron transport complex protein RnfD